MGFRSTLATFDWPAFRIPCWFREKYARDFYFGEDTNDFPISTRREVSLYKGGRETFEVDLQKALMETTSCFEQSAPCFVLVWLHECGGITRVEIHRDRIVYTEPETWRRVDEVQHWHCYGCSDSRHLPKES